MRDNLLDKSMYKGLLSNQGSLLFQLSKEERTRIASKDFGGKEAEAFLKDLIEKKEKQALVMSNRDLEKMVGYRKDYYIGFLSKPQEDQLIQDILSQLAHVEPHTEEASTKGRIIESLLPAKYIHAKIARKVIENAQFMGGRRGRSHFMSLEGLQEVLVGGIYHILLMDNLESKNDNNPALSLLASKELQNRIARKITQGLEAKKMLENPVFRRYFRDDTVENKLQSLVAQKVLQQLVHTVPFPNEVADEKFRALLAYGRLLNLVSDKGSLNSVSAYLMFVYRTCMIRIYF